MKEKMLKMAVNYIASYIRHSRIKDKDKAHLLGLLGHVMTVFDHLEREAETYDLDELREVA